MEKNKNITAVTIGFFLMIIIAAMTIYRSQHVDDDARQNDPEKPPIDTAAPQKEPYELSASELSAKMKSQRSLVIIDARSPEAFRLEHILDSKNIPLEKIDSVLPTLDANKSYAIVDDGTASGLPLVTDVFPKNNLKNVFYLDGGFPNWKNRNEPTISFGDPNSFTDQAKVNYLKSDQLKNLMATPNSLTIIDLRGSDRFAEGHLSGAINIPIDNIESQRSQIPVGKKIILYDKDGLWAFQGAVRLFEMGFFNVFCLADGLDGWQKNNYGLTK